MPPEIRCDQPPPPRPEGRPPKSGDALRQLLALMVTAVMLAGATIAGIFVSWWCVVVAIGAYMFGGLARELDRV